MPTVRYRLTVPDYRVLSAYLCSPQRTRSMSWPALLAFVIATTTFAAVAFRTSGRAFVLGMFVAALALMFYFQHLQSRAQKLFVPRQDGVFLCEHEVTLTDEGVRTHSVHGAGELKWSAVIAVDETQNHIFIRYDTTSASVIPKAAFPNAELAREFVGFAIKHAAGGRSA